MKGLCSKVNRCVPLVLWRGMAPVQAMVTATGMDSAAGRNWRTAAALEADLQHETLGYNRQAE
jgi:hypothetical protein